MPISIIDIKTKLLNVNALISSIIIVRVLILLTVILLGSIVRVHTTGEGEQEWGANYTNAGAPHQFGCTINIRSKFGSR